MSLEISVIIPTFNREKYIGRCIRSLLTQSIGLTNFEMIVIDDVICEEYQDDIKIIQNKKNLGLPISLNTGIKASRGKYIVRVDSDDYVNKDFLKILHLFVSSNNDYSAAACDYFLVDDNENVIERINCDNKPIGCGIIFETKDLISIGLYNENFLLHEEKELRERYEKKYTIKRVPLPLYRYRKHPNNMTNDIKNDD